MTTNVNRTSLGMISSMLNTNCSSSAHPWGPEINVPPGSKDYGMFPGAPCRFSRGQKAGRWIFAPSFWEAPSLSRKQDCILSPIPGHLSPRLEA